MSWPIPSDYYEAIQNPRYAFDDPELKAGTPPCNPITGLPVLGMSGNFATVYKLVCGGRLWAVRCFLREFADQERRYDAISNHLRAANLASTVSFAYLRRGIRVRGEWYPILKMEWTEGVPLNAYVGQHLHHPQVLQSLSRQWVDLVGGLRKARIAHGDLQHGNVLVCGGSLKLIDYDGMYVPALAGMKSNEEGHRNYQHPARTSADFGEHLDHFPAWVIFASLSIVAREPRLWHLLGSGDDHLLFRRDDFKTPASSKAFGLIEVSGNSESAVVARHLRSLLSMPLDRVPPLDGVAMATTPPAIPTQHGPSGLPDWINPNDVRREPPADVPVGLREETAVDDGETDDVDEWWRGHVTDQQPIVPAWAGISMTVERIGLVLASGVLVLCTFVLGLGLAPANVLIVIAVGATLSSVGPVVLLLVRYRSLQLVAQKSVASSNLDRAKREYQSLTAMTAALRLERSGLGDSLVRLDEQFRAVVRDSDRESAQARHSHSRRTAEFDRRVQELRAAEARELDGVDAEVERVVGPLQRRLNALDQEQRQEEAERLAALFSAHVDRYMQGSSITTAGISGIGPKLQARLVQRGIRSAFEVTNWAVRSVEGIGDAKAEALLSWRRVIEHRARACGPKRLPDHETLQIAISYNQKRELLPRQIEDARKRGQSQTTALAQKYSALVAEVERERRKADDELNVTLGRIRATHLQEQARIKRQFDAMSAEVDAERKRLDAKLAGLVSDQRQRKLAVRAAERELKRFDDVSFGSYLRRVVGMKR